MDRYLKGAEVISLFCRINMNAKRELPIRASEMGLLIYLVKNDQSPTPLEVAGFFKISKPMVTAMIRVLEHKGYIVKVPSEADGRSFTLFPTQKATLLVEETCQEYVKCIELMCIRMGIPEYERLISLMETANNVLLEQKENE